MYTVSIAALFFLGAAVPGPNKLPDQALSQLGQPGNISYGMAILPGETGVLTLTDKFICKSAMNGFVQELTPRSQIDFVHSNSLFSKSTIFFSSDFKSLFTNELYDFRYSFPLDGNPAGEKIITKIDETTYGNLYGLQCAGNNQLIGLTPLGQLHRYNAKDKKWILCDSTAVPHVKWFEAGGSTVVFAGRSRFADRTKPVDATIHDLDQGRDLKPIRFEQLYDFSLSRDGKTLAAIVQSATLDRLHVQVWDLPKREMRKISLRHPADRIFLSADGSKFACVDHANSPAFSRSVNIPTLEFYDAERGKILSSSSLAGDTLQFGQFLSDGKTFFALGQHGVIHRWDVPTGKPFEMGEGHRGTVTKVVHLADGYGTLARDGRYIRWGADFKPKSQWDLTPQLGESVYGDLAPTAISPDGKTLYTLDIGNVSRLVARDLSTGKLIPEFQYELPEEHFATALCVSPDGKRIGVSMTSTMRDRAKFRGFVLLDVTNGKPIPIATTPDGRSKAELGRSFQMQFTAPDRILAGNIQGYHSYALSTGEHQFTVEDHGMGDNAAVFAVSPDGKQFACLLKKQELAPGCDVGLRDTTTSKLLRRLPFESVHYVYQRITALAFSKDGKRLAVGLTNGDVFVYETSGEGKPLEFLGHKQAVRCIDFAPDGKTFITGSDDTSAIVWKLDAK